MSDQKRANAGEVTIARHRPERLGDFAVVGSICCSSCCCCCVHSFGAVAGAMVGSAVAASAPTGAPNVTDADRAASTSVISMYWAVLIGLSVLIIAVSALLDSLIVGIGIVLLGGPLVQLGVSALMLPIVYAKQGPAQNAGLRALGRITLFAFLGSLIGGIVMLMSGGVLLGLLK